MHSKKIKLIFFDLDNTLLDTSKRISNQTVEYLKKLNQEKNIRFVFSTGRILESAKPIMLKYGLEGFIDGMICNAGADIHFFTENCHFKNAYISKETVLQVINSYKDSDIITVCFHGVHDDFIATRYTPSIQALMNRCKIETFHTPDEIEIIDVPKISLVFDENNINKARIEVANHPFEEIYFTFSEVDNGEYVHKSNNKLSGCKKYLDHENIDLSETMFFGDSENDRDMMGNCGISVCMKNGDIKTQQLADFVTDKTNDEDGVLDFLMKHEDLF